MRKLTALVGIMFLLSCNNEVSETESSTDENETTGRMDTVEQFSLDNPDIVVQRKVYLDGKLIDSIPLDTGRR
jgi:hypothetical protein